MGIAKRIVLWDWTNTAEPDVAKRMDQIKFGDDSPVSSVINWNTWIPPELNSRGLYRPMVRGVEHADGNEWKIIENSTSDTILFFNEPERAGITPEHARDIWYKRMVPLRQASGKKLGSPATASDESGKQWLGEFMTLVALEPPDFLCLHWYSHDTASAQNYLQNMHDQYPDLPVMVTEIACLEKDYAKVLRYTGDMCKWMDEQNWIFEYGFFDFQRTCADDFVSPAAQLMQPNGDFTDLGRKYLFEYRF